MDREQATMTLNNRSDYRIEQIPLGHRDIKHFAMFPWRLYRGDPCWTPPLMAELLGNRLFGTVGLLQPRHPYHRQAEVTHFMAWRGEEPVGRISAAINHRLNEYHNLRAGFFGFFEVINDYEVARILLDEARGWVKSRGMNVLRGPGEYSNATHERQGVLIDGFQHPPTFDLNHNPPFYARFLEKYGFVKAKDYHAYSIDVPGVGDVPPQLKALAAHARRRFRIQTRPIVMKKLHQEVRLLVDIYNDAWAHNWGFLPILAEEASAMADSLRLVADPNGIRFAYVDGEPSGVLGILPDPNYCLRPRWRWYGDSDAVRMARLLLGRRRIPRARLFFFGIRRPFRNHGIDAVMAEEVWEYGSKLHYQNLEASLVLEDNERTIGDFEFLGGKRYKTWRIYELPLM